MHPFMYRLLCSTCFHPPGDPPSPVLKPGDPGYVAPVEPEDDDDEPPAGLTPEAKAEFEKVRRRQSKYRLEAKELRTKLDAETADRAKAIADATVKVTADIQAKADQRVINSEVRTALKAANVADVGDAMKILDISKLKLGDDGEVIGVDDLISAAKTGKPYLFKALTTSNIKPPPSQKGPGPKHAKDMTEAEAEAAEKELTGGR